VSTHSKIQLLLYEYVRGELTEDDLRQVEAHLAVCQVCAQEVDELKQFVKFSMEYTSQPSDTRSTEYWNEFASNVERKIQESEMPARQPIRVPWYEEVLTFLTLRWRLVAAMSAAVSVVVLAIIIWRMMPSEPPREIPNTTIHRPAISAQQAAYDERVADYFRRSKMLLIGVTNMKVDDNEPTDLSAERRVSRELVHEARYLKQQPIDYRSAQLIDDLQKILIELANAKEQGGAPNVELVRAGVHQENLLFKIRMAETLYDTARFTTADQKYAGERKP
jgi:anti-sigma-K factor RskA